MNLFDVDFTTDFSGAKSSEGDGRTAADVELEQCVAGICGCAASAAAEEASDGAE